MPSRSLPVALLLALLTVDALHIAAQQGGRSNSPDVAETLAVRTVLSQFIGSGTPSAVIARLGLRAEDEQVLRAELARYREIDVPLRERTELLARAYATTPRDEDQKTRLAIEAERAALRIDTHARIIQRLSDDGRSKWLARIGEARKQVMAPPTLDGSPAERIVPVARRAASLTVTGRLLNVTCGSTMILQVDTGTALLRLVIEDPTAVSVLGVSGGETMLQCGGQNVPIRIGYDPVSAAADGTAGVVRVLDYRETSPQ
jgi:hypothetical protein